MLLVMIAIGVAAGALATAFTLAIGGSWLVALGVYSTFGATAMLVGMILLPIQVRRPASQNQPTPVGVLETR